MYINSFLFKSEIPGLSPIICMRILLSEFFFSDFFLKSVFNYSSNLFCKKTDEEDDVLLSLLYY